MKQAPRDRPSARGLRVAIVRSLFNRPVTDGLLAGARQALAEMGADERRLRVFDLPGAFELPLAAQAAALSGRFDAVVARETGVPVAFGVLTVRQEEQARQRAAAGPDNKGGEAARAAVMTALALRAIPAPRPAARRRSR